MCTLFTPISQEASYDTVQLPDSFEDKLVKPAPLLTYNSNSRRVYRIPDFKVKDRDCVKNQISSSVPARIEINLIYIVLSLN